MTIYSLIKTIHILAAIVALGFNLSYMVWFTLAKKNTPNTLYTLEGVLFLDRQFANRSYALTFISGILLVYTGHYPVLHTPWILCSLILFGAMAVIGSRIYKPALARQINALRDLGFESADYKRAEKLQNLWGLTMCAFAFMVVVFMVTKPGF